MLEALAGKVIKSFTDYSNFILIEFCDGSSLEIYENRIVHREPEKDARESVR